VHAVLDNIVSYLVQHAHVTLFYFLVRVVKTLLLGYNCLVCVCRCRTGQYHHVRQAVGICTVRSSCMCRQPRSYKHYHFWWTILHFTDNVGMLGAIAGWHHKTLLSASSFHSIPLYKGAKLCLCSTWKASWRAYHGSVLDYTTTVTDCFINVKAIMPSSTWHKDEDSFQAVNILGAHLNTTAATHAPAYLCYSSCARQATAPISHAPACVIHYSNWHAGSPHMNTTLKRTLQVPCSSIRMQVLQGTSMQLSKSIHCEQGNTGQKSWPCWVYSVQEAPPQAWIRTMPCTLADGQHKGKEMQKTRDMENTC
jgi:hypothetical protein